MKQISEMDMDIIDYGIYDVLTIKAGEPIHEGHTEHLFFVPFGGMYKGHQKHLVDTNMYQHSQLPMPQYMHIRRIRATQVRESLPGDVKQYVDSSSWQLQICNKVYGEGLLKTLIEDDFIYLKDEPLIPQGGYFALKIQTGHELVTRSDVSIHIELYGKLARGAQ